MTLLLTSINFFVLFVCSFAFCHAERSDRIRIAIHWACVCVRDIHQSIQTSFHLLQYFISWHQLFFKLFYPISIYSFARLLVTFSLSLSLLDSYSLSLSDTRSLFLLLRYTSFSSTLTLFASTFATRHIRRTHIYNICHNDLMYCRL